ncbi:MAG: adenylosuccinate lyase [Micrococcales bacterium]|nr:MAG: adenylosuccinate lyase [Micrococcales bacterium]PIE26061.1 MAG: adenylosuccinate lyase [Micrococcales bacterium]
MSPTPAPGRPAPAPVPPAATSLADAGIALGPLDGRYRPVVAALVDHLSEPALNRHRLHVEVEWLIRLCAGDILAGVPRLHPDEADALRSLVTGFDAAAVADLAALERHTAHDVKAVEYYVRDRLPQRVRDQAAPLVHFCCTSEDINNLSYALMLKGALTQVWVPAAAGLLDQLRQMAETLAGTPMLAHTHGQPATPTTIGKELAVFAHRLSRQLRRVEAAEYLGKFNGASGTYSAHVVAEPAADWQQVSHDFVTSLGLEWNPLTTQIESHDWQAELYADIARFNRILHNLCTDVWAYISMGYFTQDVSVHGSTGSSTMPHKVNPIRFENAEANLEVSCAVLDVLAGTLVTSRLQRDLTDSSMQRNAGVALGHSLLAVDNVCRGLAGITANETAMAGDLDANWEVLGEAVQSVMRAAGAAGVAGMADPYERVKDLTRGRRVDVHRMREFIDSLGLPAPMAQRLIDLRPHTYTGLAAELARSAGTSADR